MSDTHRQFLPACPISLITQPEERIKVLKEFLKTDFGQFQRLNVEALIRLYETGEIGPRRRTDPPIFLVDGKIVEKDPWEYDTYPKSALRWCEVY
ncbi:hypothetical protein N7493_009878 [Penicillium malachiteum]|uniref:Uncharacterized protein n=1 Tax=Penicillium malachiteum TaxID=1324776 RepID=A0AAD6HDN2_9EURO|nr:hypothetical protein N7493_009878 [Penicillium malachiteum]